MIYLRSADDTLSALYSHYTHQPIPDFPAHARDIATLPGPRAAAILREIDVNVPATTAARRTAVKKAAGIHRSSALQVL